jgi:hypothetical protein
MREIQRLMITQDILRDTTNITINNPDGGAFTLTHMDPNTGTPYVSSMLNTNMSAYNFMLGIQNFYQKVHGAWISVSLTMY